MSGSVHGQNQLSFSYLQFDSQEIDPVFFIFSSLHIFPHIHNPQFHNNSIYTHIHHPQLFKLNHLSLPLVQRNSPER
ncbi:hypothetical protein L1887_38170 [Cichorium endivia]|nr:hypothetical protein L1887_38170 [Cichorium endivia]